jgi:hypothetical protein
LQLKHFTVVSAFTFGGGQLSLEHTFGAIAVCKQSPTQAAATTTTTTMLSYYSTVFALKKNIN